MLPMIRVTDPAMKKYLRPKMSDKRPPMVTNIAPPRFQEMVIQVYRGSGPRSALIKVKIAGGISRVKRYAL
jgi:hypothetical protein